MTQVTFQSEPVAINGQLPTVGNTAPAFHLTNGELAEQTLSALKGKKVILNIFPSVDTPVCAASVRAFNEAASHLENVIVLCISADLPFAQGRFCGAENLNNVMTLSTFQHPEFLTDYGVAISEGPLRGLATRAVVCIDEKGDVVHSERVSEITQEPDYDTALTAIQTA